MLGSIPQTLPNGITLPDVWPPRDMDRLSREPMPVPYLRDIPPVIPINLGRQLFVDNFLIEHATMFRRFHLATKYEGNPIFKPETELEISRHPLPGAAPKSGGVWYDSDAGLFRMIYEACWLGTLAYAQSVDGLTWQRPNLHISPGTNQVLPSELRPDSTGFILDPHTTDPSQKYKLLLRGPNPVPEHRAWAMTSPDGIHWSAPVYAGPCGDRTTVFYNPFRRRWVYSLRCGNKHGRARHYWESEDFLQGAQWTDKDPVYWVGADDQDETLCCRPQLYNLDAVAYESLMLGMFQIFKGPENHVSAKTGVPKLTELSLAYSRDGFHWHRPDRRAFIAARREAGSWERGYVQSTASVCTVMGDELWFYYIAFAGGPSNDDENWQRHGMYANGATGLAKLRRDGFASMEVGAEPGSVTTRPVTFDGVHLFVNADTELGELRVEALDESGTAIEPFTVDHCVPMRGNSTKAEVSWMGAADLEALRQGNVRFRFHMTGGRIYAFWVSGDSRGASGGYVAAGGPGYANLIDV